MKRGVIVALALALLASSGVRAEENPFVPKDFSGFYWQVTGEAHFAGHLMTGPMYAFGGQQSSFAFPFVGGGVWAAGFDHGKWRFLGVSATFDWILNSKPFDNVGGAVGIQFSPLERRIVDHLDFDVYIKPVYTYYVWKIDQVPHHAVGIQLTYR